MYVCLTKEKINPVVSSIIFIVVVGVGFIKYIDVVFDRSFLDEFEDILGR